MARTVVVAAFVGLCLVPVLARADVTLIGVAEIPGDAADLSGLTGRQSDGTPHNQFGGVSALASTADRDQYVALSDRGPKDGASDYVCRFHRLTVRVDPQARPAVSVRLTATTLLTDGRNRRLVGSLDAWDEKNPADSLRFDPEGLRVGPAGTLFVADEYGPDIAEFAADGRLLRRLPVPARFRPARPARTPEAELPPHNTAGRAPNRGFEGLAMTPNGARLYAILQGPLLQDGAWDAAHKRVGVHCRILEIPVDGGRTREFVYRLDDPSYGVSEILAVNDRQFLVLERDGKAGRQARFKQVVRIDLSGATDVSDRAALPAAELPPAVVPVKKTPFLDLLDPRYGIAGEQCPEKFEGLAFGPDLPDGRRVLLVATDNDFRPDQPSRVYAFAVDAADLPGFRPPTFKLAR